MGRMKPIDTSVFSYISMHEDVDDMEALERTSGGVRGVLYHVCIRGWAYKLS